MKKLKCIAWLYQELPRLIENGVLSQESAQKLQDYYGEVNPRSKMQLALTIFAVVGAACIGLGIILLFAYNWDHLSKGGRTVLALAPLVISNLLCIWAVFKDKTSASIREGLSVFNMLSVGAAISLISQIYHMPGDIDSLLLVWMLLSMPLMYLMSSSLVAILYMAGITTWAAMSQIAGGHALLFWPLVACVFPLYLKHLSKDRYSSISAWLSTAICICFSVAIGISLEKVLPGLWVVVYSAFYVVLYLIAKLWFAEAPSFWQNPFRNFGLWGVTILSYIFTFEWVWDSIGWGYYRCGRSPFNEVAGVADYIIATILVVTAIILLVRCLKEKGCFEISLGVMPLLGILSYLLCGFGGNEFIGVWIFNLYVLYLGIINIVTGVKERNLLMTNAGTLILSVLIFTRFLDSSLGIIERGIVFIFIGTCFILSNVYLSKRMTS